MLCMNYDGQFLDGHKPRFEVQSLTRQGSGQGSDLLQDICKVWCSQEYSRSLVMFL
jgi:hypothetical protein